MLNRKTQIRGQIRAALHQPVQWQAELQHRLSKVTLVKCKVHSGGGQQGRGNGTCRLQMDHKDHKHFWSCSCFQDKSGKELFFTLVGHMAVLVLYGKRACLECAMQRKLA